jgi:hypothetical protein
VQSDGELSSVRPRPPALIGIAPYRGLSTLWRGARSRLTLAVGALERDRRGVSCMQKVEGSSPFIRFT